MPADGSKGEITFAGRFTASAIAACFAEVPYRPVFVSPPFLPRDFNSNCPSIDPQIASICFLPEEKSGST